MGFLLVMGHKLYAHTHQYNSEPKNAIAFPSLSVKIQTLQKSLPKLVVF